MNEEGVARGLGWLSLGLGTVCLLAPARVASLAGLRDDDRMRTTARLLGLRELAAGTGILTRRRPAGLVWTRVAGDTMDLALLGAALATDAPRPGRTAGTLAALAGVGALDVWCAVRLSASGHAGAGARGIEVKRAITVLKPPSEVYRFWRDFGNLPRFMRHLDSVRVLSESRSHWKANGPAGAQVEWEAEIFEDRPNELITWRSLPGAAVANAGSVRFTPAPGGRGTEIRVELRYEPPAGRLGQAFALLLGEAPGQQVLDDLRRLKQVLETGQITFSDATVKGRGAAQPPAGAPSLSADETGGRLTAASGTHG